MSLLGHLPHLLLALVALFLYGIGAGATFVLVRPKIALENDPEGVAVISGFAAFAWLLILPVLLGARLATAPHRRRERGRAGARRLEELERELFGEGPRLR